MPSSAPRDGDQSLLPSCRIGYINPLDIIDTSPYEFYRLAPRNAIVSMISIGLEGFSRQDAVAAVDANLERCIRALTRRGVEFIVLGGLPMLFNLGATYSREFANLCAEQFGTRAGTSVDAAVAAFKSLRVSKIAVINKWDADLNALVSSTLAAEGVPILGAVTEVHTVAEIKATFEAGIDVALRLTEKALAQFSDADCLFIAGGAWLVTPFIPQIEQEFGVAVVAGQQSKIWYSLNMVGNHINRPEHGRLMNTAMKAEPG